MRKLLLLAFILGLSGEVYSAELLVKAKPHWMDTLTIKQVEALSVEQKKLYDVRSQVGDIIVIRPDGWEWGKEECLPNFVVIKIPDVRADDIKSMEINHFLPKSMVTSAVSAKTSVVTKTASLLNSVTEKEALK